MRTRPGSASHLRFSCKTGIFCVLSILAVAIYVIGERGRLEVGWAALGVAVAGAALAAKVGERDVQTIPMAISSVSNAELARLGSQTLGQLPIDLGQQQPPHVRTRRLVKPVQEPAAAGRLAQALIGLEAGAGEELLHFRDGLQAPPDKAIEEPKKLLRD